MTNATLTLSQATILGYAITSRASGHATRLDRRDWREYMAQKHAPWDPVKQGMDWVKSLDSNGHSAADHYRRVHSKDIITVPVAWMSSLKNSGQGPREYRVLPISNNLLEEQKNILVDILGI